MFFRIPFRRNEVEVLFAFVRIRRSLATAVSFNYVIRPCTERPVTSLAPLCSRPRTTNKILAASLRL